MRQGRVTISPSARGARAVPSGAAADSPAREDQEQARFLSSESSNSLPCCGPRLCLFATRKVTSRVTWHSRRPCPLNKAPRRQQCDPNQQTNEPTLGWCHSFWQALRQGTMSGTKRGARNAYAKATTGAPSSATACFAPATRERRPASAPVRPRSASASATHVRPLGQSPRLQTSSQRAPARESTHSSPAACGRQPAGPLASCSPVR